MNLTGIIIGAASFLIIGILHPVVIQAEYHFGKGIWPLFLLGGLACILSSLFLHRRHSRRIAGRVGLLAAVVHPRVVRAGRTRAKGLVPGQPQTKILNTSSQVI